MSATVPTVERFAAETQLLDQLAAARLMPVVTATDAAQAEPLVDALVAGGIGAVEITLRTEEGVAAIARIAHRTDLLIGAGTVLDIEQAEQVAAAGARFAISPGLDKAIVERLRALGVLPLPGVATATELQQAHGLGLTAVKLFPAGQLGGLDFVRAMHGPFPMMRFLPSGGVSPSNARDYLAHPAVVAVSGSWMVPPDAIGARDWARITALAAEAVSALDGVER